MDPSTPRLKQIRQVLGGGRQPRVLVHPIDAGFEDFGGAARRVGRWGWGLIK